MPKVILSKICVRCSLEQPVDEFRLANRKITDICKTCRSKCVVCGSLILHPKNLRVKYCSDECRRVTDRLQKANRLKSQAENNPDHYKEQYAIKKAKGHTRLDSERSKKYYLDHKNDPEFIKKRLNHARSYYYRNREAILNKKCQLRAEQRDEYNSRIREWRKQRIENLSLPEQEALKQHQRSLNRQTRARQRLAKMRLDFAKIEELNNE